MNGILSQLPFWDNLSDEEKSLCEMSAVINQYKKGSYLLGGCDTSGCLGMIHVLSGEIRAFIVSEEGREITLFQLTPGENCVLSASCVLSQITFETHLFVSDDAEVLLIPSSVFAKLMDKNVHVRCFAFELATQRFSTVMWVMQQIVFHGYDKRLADFLVSEYEKSETKEIHMTQEKIAVATNSAREVVARMLRQFVLDGLIESKRGVIIIKDIDGVKNIS